MEKRIITLFFIMAFTFLGYGQQKKASYIFVIQPKYDKEGRALVYMDKVGDVFIDKTGKVVINLKKLGVNEAYPFSEGLAQVKIKDKWGYINKAGKLVIPAKFDGASAFHEGLAWVRIGGLLGCIKYNK